VELVWLAEVESGLRHGARSPAGGAGDVSTDADDGEDLGLSCGRLNQRKQRPRRPALRRVIYRKLHGKFGDWRAGGGGLQTAASSPSSAC